MPETPNENQFERFKDAYVAWFTSSNNATTAQIQRRREEQDRLNRVASEAFLEAKSIIVEEARTKGSAALQEFRVLETIPQNMRGQMRFFFDNLLLALLDDLKK